MLLGLIWLSESLCVSLFWLQETRLNYLLQLYIDIIIIIITPGFILQKQPSYSFAAESPRKSDFCRINKAIMSSRLQIQPPHSNQNNTGNKNEVTAWSWICQGQEEAGHYSIGGNRPELNGTIVFLKDFAGLARKIAMKRMKAMRCVLVCR